MAEVQCYLVEASLSPVHSLSKALPACAPVTGVHLLITDDSAISYKCIVFEVCLGLLTHVDACFCVDHVYIPAHFFEMQAKKSISRADLETSINFIVDGAAFTLKQLSREEYLRDYYNKCGATSTSSMTVKEDT